MEPQVIIFIAASGATGLVLGGVLGRYASGRAAGALTGALAVIGAVLFVMARSTQGWDAIGYFILAAIFVVPAALGAALGGWIGARWRRRAAASGQTGG